MASFPCAEKSTIFLQKLGLLGKNGPGSINPALQARKQPSSSWLSLQAEAEAVEEVLKEAGQPRLNHKTGQLVHCTSAPSLGGYDLIIVITDTYVYCHNFQEMEVKDLETSFSNLHKDVTWTAQGHPRGHPPNGIASWWWKFQCFQYQWIFCLLILFIFNGGITYTRLNAQVLSTYYSLMNFYIWLYLCKHHLHQSSTLMAQGILSGQRINGSGLEAVHRNGHLGPRSSLQSWTGAVVFL